MIESASPAISRKAIKRELLEAKGGVASELPSEAQLEKMQVSAIDCLRAPSEAPSSLPPSSPPSLPQVPPFEKMLTLPAASLAMTSQFPFMLAELGDALLHAGCAKRVVRLRELIAEAIPGLPSGIQLAKSIEQGNTKLGVLWRNYFALLLACAGGCVAQSQRLLHPESPELNPSSKPLATPPPLPPVLPPPPPDEDDEDNEGEGRGHVSEAPFEEAPPTSLATLPAKFDRLVATARGGEGSAEMAIWGDGDLGGEGSIEMGMWLMGAPHAGFNSCVPPPPPPTGSARASMPPPLKLSARVGAVLPPVTARPPLLGSSVQPPSPPPSPPHSPFALDANSPYTKFGSLRYETFSSVLIGGRGVGGCTPAAVDVKQVEVMISDGEARINPTLDLLWSSLNLETVSLIARASDGPLSTSLIYPSDCMLMTSLIRPVQ